MLLGQFVDENEKTNHEYKEFCFKFNIYDFYTSFQIKNILHKGILPYTFDDIILYNIQKYIEIYIPRYACSFHNTQIATSHTLVIGINDDKEITGIPFFGNMNQFSAQFIKRIQNELNNNLNSSCCLSFRLHIQRCNVNWDIIDSDNYIQLLDNMESAKKNYASKYKQYVIDKKKWIEEMYFYKGKVNNIVHQTHIRTLFINWMKRENVYDQFPNFHLNYSTIDFGNISKDKRNTTSIIYWIIKFKDAFATDVVKKKPIEPKMPKILNMEYCLITKLSNLRKFLLDKNPTLQYYVMYIDMYNEKCKNTIKFNDIRTKNWRKMKRHMLQTGPQCIDF